MNSPLPIVLVPGLCCSARLYGAQIPALWRVGPVTIAIHNRDDSIAAIARRIFSSAPPSFALVGLSMGGYIAFEMLRQQAERISKLALLDTSARADSAEQIEARLAMIELTERGKYSLVPDMMMNRSVHPSRLRDDSLRQVLRDMADDTGPEAYIRQQHAIIARVDSRPGLGAISCPTLVLVGDSDQVTPLDRAEEIVNGIPGAKLIVAPECGHLSTLEQPGFTMQALVEFLAE